MDLDLIWAKLGAAGIGVWLDSEGKLRIDKEAPATLKELVREHKPEVVAVLQAQETMSRSGVRIVRLPLGRFALAKPPGPLPENVAQAIKTLRLDHLSLVHNDEGGRWMPYREWLCRRPVYDREELLRWRRAREVEEQARMQRGRRKSA